jgi:hypothetical protein
VQTDNKEIQEQAKEVTKPDEGLFGGAQKILLIGGGIWLASKLIK